MTPSAEPILEVEDLATWYDIGFLGRTTVKAVDGISLTIGRRETLGLVGESGCGKSTLGRTLARLGEPTRGTIRLEGEDITHHRRAALRRARRRMQFVFQDPYSSLNPRKTVAEALSAPLAIHEPGTSKAVRRDRAVAVLEAVGLSAGHLERYPHEFSGGQRQRVGIARALIVDPSFIIADEPVSALDVSVQAQIVNLLIKIRRERALSMIFIAHDLAVVGYLADRVAVMYLGRIMEIGPTSRLYRQPRHPYTEALLSAALEPNPAIRRLRIVLRGDPPSPLAPPSGCLFRTRCSYALPACAVAAPLRETSPGHFSACIRDDLSLADFAGQRSDPVPQPALVAGSHT